MLSGRYSCQLWLISTVKIATLLDAGGMVYSHPPPAERSEVRLKINGRRRRLETHRLLFLNQMDQVVQHWSKVSGSDRDKKIYKSINQVSADLQTNVATWYIHSFLVLLGLDVVKVFAQWKVPDWSVLGQPHQQRGQVRVQAWKNTQRKRETDTKIT